MTSTKTRSGAIALSAPTKTLPKRAMPEALGTSRPRIIPSASPPIILLMRLILIHLSNNFSYLTDSPMQNFFYYKLTEFI